MSYLHREIATSIARHLTDEYGQERWGDICMGIAWFLSGIGSAQPGPQAIEAIAEAAKAISATQAGRGRPN